MDANEIMIGDWVMTEAGVMRVAQIFKNHIDCDVPTGCKTWEITTIEPIPLTPEILEKNGFIVKHPESVKRTYWKDRAGQIVGHKNRGLMYMEISGNPVKFGYFLPHFSGHIQYVHQLQHALHLCGITLNIEV